MHSIVPAGNSPTDHGQLIAAYGVDLRRRGRAPATCWKYRHTAELLASWSRGRPLASLTSNDIERFLEEWELAFESQADRPASRSTVRGLVCGLRSFYAYVDRRRLLVDDFGRPLRNPMTAIIAPERAAKSIDFLRPDEDEALLNATSLKPTERTVVWFLRWTGVRVAEACSVQLKDISLIEGAESVKITVSKTRAGRRVIPLLPEVIPEIRSRIRQLEAMGFTDGDTWFLATRSGRPMTTGFVWRLVKRAGLKANVRPIPCTCERERVRRHLPDCPRKSSGANLSDISPHTLRRTFGSDLINRGLRLEVVSRLLGHSSTAVTEQSYAHLLDKTIRQELFDVMDATRSGPPSAA